MSGWRAQDELKPLRTAQDNKESFHMRCRARNKGFIDPSLPRAAGVCGRRKGKGQFQSAQKAAAQGAGPQTHRVVGVQVRWETGSGFPPTELCGWDVEMSSLICDGHLGSTGTRECGCGCRRMRLNPALRQMPVLKEGLGVHTGEVSTRRQQGFCRSKPQQPHIIFHFERLPSGSFHGG